MDRLIIDDLHHVLDSTPRDVRELISKNPQLFLAGGFIRSVIAGEKINDIDIFGPSVEVLKEVAMGFAIARQGRLYSTDNAFTVLTPGRTPVQFIHRWTYKEPWEVIDGFDFTVAQAVIYWYPGSEEVNGGWLSRVSDYFYPDLASKRLRYMSPARHEDAGGSILRMRKFLSRGYHIEALSLAKVVARLAKGVRGVDMEEGQLSMILTGLLREVDPLAVIDGVESEVPEIKIEEGK